jgi:heat shock protein HslJ
VTARPLLASPLALAVLAGACGSGGPSPSGPIDGHPATLAGTSWIVVSVGELAAVPGSQPTMAFGPTAVSGNGGCNAFGGPYQYEPSTGRLAFGQLAMTLVACADHAKNVFETRLIQALGPTLQATLDADGRLMLSGPGGLIVLAAIGPTVTD